MVTERLFPFSLGAPILMPVHLNTQFMFVQGRAHWEGVVAGGVVYQQTSLSRCPYRMLGQ